MAPTVLITRPEPAAQEFADAVRRRFGAGVAAVVAPVMRIEPYGELPDLAGFAALIFTSRNGVAAFAAQTTGRDLPCFTVGDATADAARAIGLDAISAGGAAGDLVRLIRESGHEGPFLHLRGEHAAADISGELRLAGLTAAEVVIYRQVEQPCGPQADALLAKEGAVILPLFSQRSARVFFSRGPFNATAFVAAISDPVAEVIPAGAVSECMVAERPDAEAVLDTTGRLLDRAKRLEGGKRAQ
ncbi:uroporphyrinogen-III synthase [Roseovarius sp. SYSU LYC5161]|uniref:uroporphyrinogen-III synthase n=1 Tax=Roseovarius halophilus (ex Wu et al. 2025) TaxID=3376060 RepID=UPI0028717BAB|nr:uroporphyrinogen-III synthase [Roseovarius sp.]